MPRSMQEILDQADELARRFEDHIPDPAHVKDAAPLRAVHAAVQARATAERNLAAAVAAARASGCSWAAIGAYLGTSGEAARQRYGNERLAVATTAPSKKAAVAVKVKGGRTSIGNAKTSRSTKRVRATTDDPATALQGKSS